MAKSKKPGKKSSVKVNDLNAKQDPKGGALYIKYGDAATIKGEASALKEQTFLKIDSAMTNKVRG